MLTRTPTTLSLLLFSCCFHSVVWADVLYDAQEGNGFKVGILSRTPGWKITGTGHHTDDIEALVDQGTPAYRLHDDNLKKDNITEESGNGPTATYDYSSQYPHVRLDQDKWYFEVKQRIAGGNGHRNGALQVYDGAGQRYMLFVYQNKTGNLIASNPMVRGCTFKLGANDGKYHTYRFQHDGKGSVVFSMDGKELGQVKPIKGNGKVLTVGGGSGEGQIDQYIAKVEFGVTAPTISNASAVLGLGGFTMIYSNGE